MFQARILNVCGWLSKTHYMYPMFSICVVGTGTPCAPTLACALCASAADVSRLFSRLVVSGLNFERLWVCASSGSPKRVTCTHSSHILDRFLNPFSPFFCVLPFPPHVRMLQRVGTTTAAVLFMRDGTGAVPACFSTEEPAGKKNLRPALSAKQRQWCCLLQMKATLYLREYTDKW